MSDFFVFLFVVLVWEFVSLFDFDLNSGVVLFEGCKLCLVGVLMLVQVIDGVVQVLLIKCVSYLKYYSGQIVFSGGKQEESDVDVIVVVLCEVCEEIGLFEDVVCVLGVLLMYEIVMSFMVMFVIGLIECDFMIMLEWGEVEEVFWVLFSYVMDKLNFFVQG